MWLVGLIAVACLVAALGASAQGVIASSEVIVPIGGEQSGPPIDAATSDLAARLGVDPSQIVVESADAVNWPDSSLGCPVPGRAYSQIVTPGYRIVLTADGSPWDYHASMQGDPFLCIHSTEPSVN